MVSPAIKAVPSLVSRPWAGKLVSQQTIVVFLRWKQSLASGPQQPTFRSMRLVFLGQGPRQRSWHPPLARLPRQIATLAFQFLPRHITRIRPLAKGLRVPSNGWRCRLSLALRWSRSQIVHEVQPTPLVLQRYSVNPSVHPQHTLPCR
jgi:hypothetical protein